MSLGERLGKISDRLGVRQPNDSKPMRLENVDNRIKALEERFSYTADSYNKKVATLKGQVLKLTKVIEEDNRAYAIQAETRLKELEALDSKVNRKLEHEILQRKEGENRVLLAL
jgi:ppGpp synthetase/RelA/SpoT-type nucleotidyltranferase